GFSQMLLSNTCFSGRFCRPSLLSFGSSTHIRRLSVAALLLACGHFVSTASVARADEFSLVPVGDPLYKHFTSVRRARWNDGGAENRTRSNAARAQATESSTSLTRYEMALETARAYLSLSSRERNPDSSMLSVSLPAVRSLRELLVGLRGELRSLDIDVNEALEFCDRVLQRNWSKPATTAAADSSRESRLNLPSQALARPVSRSENREVASSFGQAIGARRASQLPISQLLRLHAALSSLVREAGDPFGDAAFRSPYHFSNGTAGNRLRSSVLSGGSYEVTDWLRLRADYTRAPLVGTTNARDLLSSEQANDSLTPVLMRSLGPAREGRSVGGGIDVALSGLTLSGQVTRVSTGGAGSEAMRFGGGVALNAWQNRLALSANLSRLVPEDSPMLSPTTAAAFNIDVGVTERLRLKLLYQQLFNSPNQNRGERMVAGGINISF
ncbi:MAG: hypothetical protein JWN98_1308, partial [Abditibacteriota bacterium]|nr:hypothetical protein [Abditibacteriota bacterium]